MPVETLTAPPCEFTAGTTVRFTVGWADYPASEWALGFHLLGASNLSVGATASGDDFAVVLTAVQTGALTPGQYRWAARVTETSGGDVIDIERGFVTVRPDLSNTTVGPWRTRYNAAVTAMGSITAGQYSSVDVEGQSFTKHELEGLQKVIDRLEIKAIAEDSLLGCAVPGNVKKIVTYI